MYCEGCVATLKLSFHPSAWSGTLDRRDILTYTYDTLGNEIIPQKKTNTDTGMHAHTCTLSYTHTHTRTHARTHSYT